MYSDLQTISPEQYMKQITKRLTELHAVSVSICKSINVHITGKNPPKYLINSLIDLYKSVSNDKQFHS